MWGAIATAFSAVCSAGALIAVALINKHAAEERKIAESREARRIKESRLHMELLDAQCELSEVITIAVTGGHTNGNVEAAQEKAQAARTKYREFLRGVAAEEINRGI